MNKILSYILILFRLIIKFMSIFYSYGLSRKVILFRDLLYTYWVENSLNQLGHRCIINYPISIYGGKYFSLGDRVVTGKNVVFEAYDKYGGYDELFTPKITIGSNVSIGDDCHITAISEITIGDNVLMGRRIIITDNSHGRNTFAELVIPPSKRKLFSKGGVVVKNNVWICDGAVILPNVVIGAGSIVAANAVVVRDVPNNCIVAGNPARIVKQIDND